MYSMFFLLCIIGPAYSSELFRDALDAHQNKLYSQAYNIYSQIPNKTAAILFNMGSCAYYEGNYYQAVALWYQAKKKGSYSIQNAAQKSIITLQTEQQVPLLLMGDPLYPLQWYKKPLYHIQDILRTILSPISLQCLIIVVVCYILFLLYTVVNYHSTVKKIQWIIRMIGAGILFFVCQYTYQCTQLVHAVVQKNDSIRLGPASHFQVLQQVVPCAIVTIEKRADSWCKVHSKDIVGWIKTESLYEFHEESIGAITIAPWSSSH